MFTADAVVIDEGETWRGASEIRTWVDDIAFRFQYTAEVLDLGAAGDASHVARVRLEGNFPGGMVELNVRFEVDGDKIRQLQNTA